MAEPMNRWVFALRFVLVAALSLALMGLLLKPYTYFLSYIVRAGLNWVAGFVITEAAVEEQWYKVKLTFLCDGKTKTIPAGFVVINMAAFSALIGATPGVGWRRACRALGIGCGIFFVWHVIDLSALLVAGVTINLAGPTGVARLLATVSFVLPFVVWLFLTRPPYIFEHFGAKRGDDDVG